MTVEQFIRKLNNTELNIQNTNDSYIRISKDIQNAIPQEFFNELDSTKVKVINKQTKQEVDNWVRFQHYPSNDEYRIVNLSSIYNYFGASSGDYIYIEKIKIGRNFHYEIYMKTYPKICLKYSKSNQAFEILNETEAYVYNLLNRKLNLSFEGIEFDSSLDLSHVKKKRSDSPTKSKFYSIKNLPSYFFTKISKEIFVEIYHHNNRFYIDALHSWSFNKFTK
jgi:hypothetical protein